MTKYRDDSDDLNNNNDEEREGKRIVIGEATPVRIGLIIGFLTIFSGAIWWAATITTKLDTILSSQTSTSSAITELKAQDISISKEISDIKLKIALSDVEIKAVKDKVIGSN